MSYYNTEFHVYFYRLMDKLIGILKFVYSHVFQNYQLNRYHSHTFSWKKKPLTIDCKYYIQDSKFMTLKTTVSILHFSQDKLNFWLAAGPNE